MKYLTLAILAITLSGKAQTNTNLPPVDGPLGPQWGQLVQFVTTGSNWMVAPFVTIADKGASIGGGLALAYKASDFLVPVLRLDYLRGSIYAPSGNLQLQVPITVFNKFTVVPFAFAGIATPIAGAGSDNGTPIGIIGAGGALRLGTHWDIVADYEDWSNDRIKGQVRLGVLYKF